MLDPGAVCELFRLPARAPRLTPVARGAVGRVWRLDTGGEPFALKELFGEPDLAAVGFEVEFTSHLVAAGVALPASVPAADGRFIVAGPGGWLRLYQWIEGTPVDLADRDLAEPLGRLLGTLHANALPPSGEVDPWYETCPDRTSWLRLAERAHGEPWSARLAACLDRIAGLSTLATPMRPSSLVTCHRDLHPENVLVKADGSWVPLDWENLGPADPDRELAKLLLDWLVTDGRIDPPSVTRTVAAYLDAGGRGRIRNPGAFGMAVAGDLNFLHLQAGMALDPGTPQEHREHAEVEIADSLDRLPAPALLEALVDAAGYGW